ncbi:hypothetical protein HanPSC8_Chr11g0496171 [Helianthus annuus]|nr:hypothetical protein HanPSC8_Chr11g0496171 [Helianthus annuus]
MASIPSSFSTNFGPSPLGNPLNTCRLTKPKLHELKSKSCGFNVSRSNQINKTTKASASNK